MFIHIIMNGYYTNRKKLIKNNKKSEKKVININKI